LSKHYFRSPIAFYSTPERASRRLAGIFSRRNSSTAKLGKVMAPALSVFGDLNRDQSRFAPGFQRPEGSRGRDRRCASGSPILRRPGVVSSRHWRAFARVGAAKP
jgi:hypothetical protein